ncbi:MAG: hypothetical protein O7G84_00815 [Gammaproteobacteria bacterium]|nr:hypothetical protein [Gammaproteobacteria bacterium]
MIELGILVAISLLLIAGAAWLMRFFWRGRRYQWPQGTRRRVVFQGYIVHVITQGEAASPELQAACMKAVAAAGFAWTLSGKRGARGKIGEVAICFVSDVAFDNHNCEPLRRSAAYLDAVPRGLGRHMPCAVIRTSLKAHVIESGDPVIHEVMCVLDGWIGPYPEPDTWELSEAARPVQKRALECYVSAGSWYIQY